MSEFTKILYFPEREDRVSGYTFYPGWIQTDGDQFEGKYKIEDPKNVYNESAFDISPGINYLTENQIKVLNATPSIADKIKNKIIEIDRTPIGSVVQPVVQPTVPPVVQPVVQPAVQPTVPPVVQPAVQPTDTRKRPPLEEKTP